MSIFGSIEDKMLEFMEDKFHMEQEFDEDKLIYRTDTYIDGRLFYTHEFDLRPMMKTLEKRIIEKLEKKK